MINDLVKNCNGELRVPLDEKFQFTIGEISTMESHNRITLENETNSEHSHDMLKLVFSCAIAQSLKLEFFEVEMDDLIEHTRKLPEVQKENQKKVSSIPKKKKKSRT